MNRYGQHHLYRPWRRIYHLLVDLDLQPENRQKEKEAEIYGGLQT